jgi:hypothetical protein
MPDGLGKKLDMEKLVEKYLSRLNGNPDSTRLLLNMLADNITDITTIRNYIIRHEFKASEENSESEKGSVIDKLAETYGLSKKEILEIVKS